MKARVSALLILPLLGSVISFVQGAVPIVAVSDVQPLVAQARRIVDALDAVGAPLGESQKAALEVALRDTNDQLAATKIQAALDSRVLFNVNINPEMRVKVTAGDAKPELVETGWRVFLIKVHNEAGTTAELRATSPNSGRLYNSPATEVRDRWLDLDFYNKAPLKKELSGLPVEYRVVSLY